MSRSSPFYTTPNNPSLSNRYAPLFFAALSGYTVIEGSHHFLYSAFAEQSNRDKEILLWPSSSALNSSVHCAASIVRRFPTRSKPSTCVHVLQDTWTAISAVSSQNFRPPLAMPSPVPSTAPVRG